MGRTPDAAEGPRIEEAVIWEEQSSDPTESYELRYVQDKGLLLHIDGAVRAVGENRVSAWQTEVNNIVNDPPGTPSAGERVIVDDTPTGAFVGHAGEIAQYNGSSWVFTTPRDGMAAYVKAQNSIYIQTATSSPWTWEEVSDGGSSGLVGGEPVGFPNRTDSTLSFVDGTRTFTISPVSASFDFYVENGAKYTKTTAQNVVISDTEGLHYIYFDTAGTLQSTTSWSNDIILKYAFVSVVYWDATNDSAILKADERHGVVMDGATHLHLHNSLGTTLYEGLALTGIVADGDGSSDTHAQVGTASGTIADEDLIFTLATDTAPAQMPVFYKSGSNGDWRRKAKDNFPAYNYPSGRLAWNEWTGTTWQQTEVTNNRFVLSHLFATDDPDQPWLVIQGESEYSTIISAREGATSELTDLVLGGLPTKEFVAVATLVFQTSNSYTNTPKARIRTLDDGSDWVDWRYSNISPTTPPSENFEESHKVLRQFIHFIETGGPAEGFASGAYREMTGTVFPTSVVWWESSSKLKKLVERTITWSGVTATVDEWKLYSTDGVTVLVTVSDAISYSGIYETSRTRTITVS